MSERWRHERRNLSELDADEDGVRRGTVDTWWYGPKDHPRRDDPQVTVDAARGPDSAWTYFVEDARNLAKREQHMTREGATEDARNRVDLYRDEGYGGGA